MKRSFELSRSTGRRSSYFSRNLVVLLATLLGHQGQLQQLANALPAGTTILVLGHRHHLVEQELATPIEAGRRTDERR
jgi:hypothetical protein